MIGQNATGIGTAPQTNRNLLGGVAAVAMALRCWRVVQCVLFPLGPPIMVSSPVRWCAFLRGPPPPRRVSAPLGLSAGVHTEAQHRETLDVIGRTRVIGSFLYPVCFYHSLALGEMSGAELHASSAGTSAASSFNMNNVK